jgi:hypothetical protein
MRRTTKPVLNNPFLARAIDEDLNSALKAFENGLAVSLIATPRDKIRTCHVDEDLATVVAANRADRFDFLPVIAPQGDPSDRIIGLIDLESFMSANATLEGAVRDHMRALSEENLIGADAGILAFVRDADQHRLRLIVSDREDKWPGQPLRSSKATGQGCTLRDCYPTGNGHGRCNTAGVSRF